MGIEARHPSGAGIDGACRQREAGMTGWVEFEQIKQAVPMEAVLRLYQWKWIRRCGDRLQGRCPIHHGQRQDAFHADLRGNGFHCFSCGAKGSVLDLVASMESCSLRHAALLLEEWFGVATTPCRHTAHDDNRGLSKELIREKETRPLRFSLHPLDPAHPYLAQRGIDYDTAAQFGVGYYPGPGLMHGRVVIPIHNGRGQLLAYAGRSIQPVNPKYLLPAGFAKSHTLFNLHRALRHASDTIVVVEGFFDCMKVHQAGFPAVVALMGCCLSEQQRALLLNRGGRIILMLDADPAGWRASRQIADQLRYRCPVDVAPLPAAMQPDQLSSEKINQILSDDFGVRPQNEMKGATDSR